jgi:phosphopentomutase
MMTTKKSGPTALILVLDAVGVTTLDYLLGKSGRRISLPNLGALGLGNILAERFRGEIPPNPRAQCARAVTQASAYPDSTIGHREMVGVIDHRTYQLFPGGFPAEYVRALEKEIGRKVFFNKMAGGMEAIEINREEHERTGFPILYASKCDPVLQLGMNETVIPVPDQHRIVDTAFALAQKMGVRITRVIGRSYVMKEGAIFRTPNRHDCTLPLEQATLVEIAARRGVRTVSVGKTAELVGAHFDEKVKLTDPASLDPACGFRFVDPKKRDTNPYSIMGTIEALDAARREPRPKGSFIFVNLVDADSLFGHTRDIEGALAAVEEIDRQLPRIMGMLRPGDLIIVTADHGMEHRADYGYHSLEPMPMLAERIGMPFEFDLFARETLALAGYLAAQLFGCADEYVKTCGLEAFVKGA